jgi:hypothetical protein
MFVRVVLSRWLGEDSMPMLDGIIKQRENQRGMAPRMYSWVLTAEKRVAFTKAHVALAREILTTKIPEPPFAIIIADSGQKQLIFRAPVSLSVNVYPIMLEDEVVEVIPSLLSERLELAAQIVAATGKPALADMITARTYITYEKYHGNTDALEAWEAVQWEPISRLAAWLSMSKEEAQDVYRNIERGEVSAGTGGIDRPIGSSAGRKTGGSQSSSDQSLLRFD